MSVIDFRSDTVTRPNKGMRAAMCAAEVGDDVFADDPTVLRLQAMVAERAGKEAGLFFPSGTQSNLAAMMAHCGRGDEYIVGAYAHTYWYEGGGAAVLGSIQPQPIVQEEDGSLDLEKVAAVVKDDDVHHPVSRLLCLENTWKGRLMALDYPAKARAFADEHGLNMHLDGARLWNAMVAQKCSMASLVDVYDTVSLCFSKGMGAPVGSVLVGSAALIKGARRWRKVLGGGMRQVGILAAACIYALEHQFDRLADDHEHARLLGEGLAALEGTRVEPVQTNMVYVDLPGVDHVHLRTWMKERGILLSDTRPLRLVTHLDISSEMVARTIAAFEAYLKPGG